MSIPAFTTALLLANAQPTAGDTPPAAPVMLHAVPAPEEQPAPSLPAVTPPPSAQTVRPAPPAGPELDEGDIIVTGRPRAVRGDPLSAVNAQSFEVTQSVDRALVGPVALTYKRKVPAPIRSGLRNFLGNLREPVVFLNFLVQLKPGKAVETLSRFAINSTMGGAGLFDVAKKRAFNLPRRRNGFADSLGYYGVKPGAFLFLPLIGPTTVRDLIGGGLDGLVLPTAFGAPFDKLAFTLPRGVISAIDYRAEFDEKLNELRDNSADPYTAARAYYLERRQAEIDGLRGKHRSKAGPEPIKTDLAPTSQTVPPEAAEKKDIDTPAPQPDGS